MRARAERFSTAGTVQAVSSLPTQPRPCLAKPFRLHRRTCRSCSIRFVTDFIGESNFLEGTVESENEGLVKVRLGQSVVPATPNGRPVQQGQRVTLVVRPERISLRDRAAGSENTLSGTVSEVVYLGTDIRYLVCLEGDETVVARIQNAGRQADHRFDVGDQVELTWSPEDARPVAE